MPNGPILNDHDLFGTSVSSVGDLNGDGVDDIAVGAIYDDAGGSEKGTVHIIFLDDTFCGQPESYYNVIYGTNFAEYIVGTNSPDLIFGYDGNDIIKTRGVNNCVYAGDGNDFVLATNNGDTVYGGAGDDSIKLRGTGIAYGEDGDDAIYIINYSIGHSIDGGNDYDLCITPRNQLINTINCEIVAP